MMNLRNRLLAIVGFLGLVGSSSWWANSVDSVDASRVAASIPSGVVLPLEMDFEVSSANPDFTHGEAAAFHGHGDQVCASGCALSRHPTRRLSKREYFRLIDELPARPLADDNLAFETLLYFGRQTSDMITHYGTKDLSPEIITVLQNELERTHVYLSIRVVDENGVVRSWLSPTKVPLDRRHVFTMETERIQPLVTSGTVKRVGLDHLWTRL